MQKNERTIRGRAAVAGIGESAYYKHGGAPVTEFELTIDAILAAARSAGISPKEIDGFVSFHDDRSDSVRLMNALGTTDFRWSTLQWGGGGGGGSGAVQQAAAAVAAGFADTIVVYRGLAQGQAARYGTAEGGSYGARVGGHLGPYGMLVPGHKDALRIRRYYHDNGLSFDTMKAVSLASYHHAQKNPRAVMYGKPLSSEKYDNSRMIIDPLRLYDMTLETDGACAVIVTSAERARDLTASPAYLVSAAQGGDHRSGGYTVGIFDEEKPTSVHYESIARRLWDYSGIKPDDVDVVQSYTNFSGLVPISLIEHGFFTPEEANEVLRCENLIADGGNFPINTSGASIAEAYIHGMELVVEAVRQIRGESCNQVKDVHVSFVNSGPGVTPGSSLIFGTEDVIG